MLVTNTVAIYAERAGLQKVGMRDGQARFNLHIIALIKDHHLLEMYFFSKNLKCRSVFFCSECNDFGAAL